MTTATKSRSTEEDALVELSLALTKYYANLLTQGCCEECGASPATSQDIRNAMAHLKNNDITFESIQEISQGPELIESMRDLTVTSEDLNLMMERKA